MEGEDVEVSMPKGILRVGMCSEGLEAGVEQEQKLASDT